MNKSNYKYIVFVATLLVGYAVQAHAEATSSSMIKGGMMRERLQENVEKNKDARNQIKMEKKDDIKGIHEERKGDMMDLRGRMSSTTEGFKMEKREIKIKARKDETLARKEALIKQLNLSIENLTKAKMYISELIAKREVAGKSVGNAKTLLATASLKIEAAKKSIAPLVAWQPEAKSASSTEITLAKPREIGSVAIKATKDAREALQAVVKEIRSTVPEYKINKPQETPGTSAAASSTN